MSNQLFLNGNGEAFKDLLKDAAKSSLRVAGTEVVGALRVAKMEVVGVVRRP